MNPFLPYGRHVIDEDDIAAVVSVLKGDWLTTGPSVDEFEANLSKICNVEHSVSCSSATAALHMATTSLELEAGSAIIVPAVTFLATASAPHLAGAEIIFADVDSETGLLTPDILLQTLKSYSGARIKAVLPVHLAGRICDMAAIKAIADEYGIAVIEDACHALGASYIDAEGQQHIVGSCAHSDMAVFSFHPVKTIAAGEGGAVTTSNAELAAKLNLARNHGMVRNPSSWSQKDLGFDINGITNPWYYEMHAPAQNYRMSDINAALGNSQLSKLSSFIARREELADHYDQLLASYAPTILPPIRQQRVNHGWHLYAARIDFSALEMTRGELIRQLRAMGIGSQVHYIPVPWQPFWRNRGWQRETFPGAASYYERTLSLPLFPMMTREDVEHVVKPLIKAAT